MSAKWLDFRTKNSSKSQTYQNIFSDLQETLKTPCLPDPQLAPAGYINHQSIHVFIDDIFA